MSGEGWAREGRNDGVERGEGRIEGVEEEIIASHSLSSQFDSRLHQQSVSLKTPHYRGGYDDS